MRYLLYGIYILRVSLVSDNLHFYFNQIFKNNPKKEVNIVLILQIEKPRLREVR
jgi:hypothetical protein